MHANINVHCVVAVYWDRNPGHGDWLLRFNIITEDGGVIALTLFHHSQLKPVVMEFENQDEFAPSVNRALNLARDLKAGRTDVATLIESQKAADNDLLDVEWVEE